MYLKSSLQEINMRIDLRAFCLSMDRSLDVYYAVIYFNSRKSKQQNVLKQ